VALGLSRDDLATALGLTQTEIAEMWKDQRELRPSDVRIIAALLGTSPAEIAEHAGISTPLPKDDGQSMREVVQRLDRLEETVAELKALILSREPSGKTNS
jgi:transcriptional regulator with XRE-family HTH domain